GGDAANCSHCRGRAVVLRRTGGGTVVLVRIVSAAADSGAAKGCSPHDGSGHANAAAGSWQQRPRSAGGARPGGSGAPGSGAALDSRRAAAVAETGLEPRRRSERDVARRESALGARGAFRQRRRGRASSDALADWG